MELKNINEKSYNMNPIYLQKENEDNYEYGLRLIQIKCETNPTDLDWQDIVDLLDLKIHRDSLRKACNTTDYSAYNVMKYFKEKYASEKEKKKELNEIEDISKQNYKTTIEISKDGSITSDKLIAMSENDCKDVNFLLKAHGYDIKAFELVNAKNNIWNVYSKQDGVSTLYSSKITVKPRTEYVWNTEDINKIFDNLKNSNINTKTSKPKNYSDNGKILVLPIADFHYGLLTDSYSNGNDYNLEIAEELFNQVINEVIENNSNNKFEKILFVLGNDSTNSDNLQATTTHGTPQDDCALWFTIVNKITELFKNAIDRLSCIAPVDVIYVPSNHDLHTMYGVMKTLEAWYNNDKNITVDTSPLPRKYYKYGKNTLVFSHDMKIKDALKIISTEAKDKWSDSQRVLCMLAHLHQAMEYEKQGMLEIRRLPTISGFSRWSNGKGYVQNERKNQSFILDYNKGITNIQNTVLSMN